MPIQRPTWLPKYLPELDGLRGLAILWVVLFHCHLRLVGTWLYSASLWGWSGVIFFFVLSGFLITSILLGTRDKPHFLHNFHARRALRTWPLYMLLLVFVYLNAPWYIGPSVADAVKTAPWLAYLFFVQNLFHLTLPPAIGPTWALAIEEQYYFFWAPTVRFLRRAVDVGDRVDRGADLVAAAAPSQLCLDAGHGHPHADSPGRNRSRQPAGAGVLHAQAQPSHMALDRSRRVCRGHSGRGHRGWRNVAARHRAGDWLYRHHADRHHHDRRMQPDKCPAAQRATEPSMAASATASI